MMKKVTMWMVISAMAVSPMLAQEADSTKNEKQQETDQVDQAIQEATGEEWVDAAIKEDEQPFVQEVSLCSLCDLCVLCGGIVALSLGNQAHNPNKKSPTTYA